MERIVIGICGGTGSGKTTLANRIYKALHGDAVLICMDSYYKDNSNLTFEERVKINYDHPNSLDTELLIEHIKSLKQGKSVKCPTYDFITHLRRKEWVTLESKRVIIVEGILTFENEELRKLMDIKIFVDTDADVRIIRRIMRDVNERGRALDAVVKQYLTTVKPMHESFVEPHKRDADIIVPEGGHNEVAYNMILSKVGSANAVGTCKDN